jgi:hypothetical protein
MALPETETVPGVPVPGSAMHYEDPGDANAVVLLHGNPASTCLEQCDPGAGRPGALPGPGPELNGASPWES